MWCHRGAGCGVIEARGRRRGRGGAARPRPRHAYAGWGLEGAPPARTPSPGSLPPTPSDRNRPPGNKDL